MAYYETFPYCMANLDPGERCDCRQIKEQFGAGNKKGPQVWGHHTNQIQKISTYSIANYSGAVKEERIWI